MKTQRFRITKCLLQRKQSLLKNLRPCDIYPREMLTREYAEARIEEKHPTKAIKIPVRPAQKFFLLKINKADVSSIKRQESLKNYQDLTVIQIKPNISEIEPKLRNQENNCLFTEKTLQNRSEHLSNDYWARCYLEKKNNSKDALI